MIGFFSRFVGLWLIAGALVALVVDATKSIAASTLTVTPLGLAWASINPASLMSVQQFFQQTGRGLCRPLAVGPADPVDPAAADLGDPGSGRLPAHLSRPPPAAQSRLRLSRDGDKSPAPAEPAGKEDLP